MRDDLLGLSDMRMFPEAWMSRAPTRSAAAARSSFASELARATLNAHKRYVSPLKATNTAQAASNAHRQATPSKQTGQAPATRPTTALNRAPATKPAAPLQRPEPTKPTTTATPTTPMALGDYPHPNGDNGRGMHWVPTTGQSNAVVDRFVAEAQRMGVKWVTFLNEGANIGQNDYLVSKLVGAGIEPIMRLYSAKLAPIQGDVEGMVRHYVGLGVRYFQPYNEPNLSIEQPDGVPSVDRYLSEAQRMLTGGGRVIASFFLLNPEARACIDRGDSSLTFPFDGAGCRLFDGRTPEYLVAHDELSVRSLAARNRLAVESVHYGAWCGRRSFLSYQDLVGFSSGDGR